jgi:myosin heavy subunit
MRSISKPTEEDDLQVEQLSDPTLPTGEGMQATKTDPAEQAVAMAEASPSWAAPAEPVVDQAPAWASAAASPALPRATNEILQLEPNAPVVTLPPIQPAAYASALNDEISRDPATEALIADLQASIREYQLENEIANERARNSEENARKAEDQVQRLEGIVEAKLILEKEFKVIKNSLHSAETEREHLLKELDKLREDRDEHERKQIVLSNRLNAAKKQEAAKANLAETLDDNVKVLQHDLEKTKKALKETTMAKEKLAEELTTSTNDYDLKIKKLEASLSEERRLNEDRKKKMKAFVENKQEELREAKAQNDELNMELSQTNRSLREHHARWKQLHAQWVQSQTRNRELQRDINRMTKESENMSRMGDQMNVKLSQRAQETETHKNKRLTAKQELMTVLETLEAEREVSSKLQDSIKFTFTPKALSQQQILKESLRDFEHELVRLSHRLGKPLPPSHDTPAETFALHNDDEEGDSEGGTGSRRSRSQIDAAHLLSNLEDETQRVSQCIMALTANIERLHLLIAQSGERSCATLLSDLLAGATAVSNEEESTMSGPRLGLGAKRSYGQVPTAHD